MKIIRMLGAFIILFVFLTPSFAEEDTFVRKLDFKGNIFCSEVPEIIQAEIYLQMVGDKKELFKKRNRVQNALIDLFIDLFSQKEICYALKKDRVFLKKRIKETINQVLRKSEVINVYFAQIISGSPETEFPKVKLRHFPNWLERFLKAFKREK